MLWRSCSIYYVATYINKLFVSFPRDSFEFTPRSAAEARLDAPDAAKRREFRLRLRPSLSGAAALLNDPSKYKGPRRHEDLLFAFQHSPPPPPELRAMMTSGAGGFGTRAIAGTAGDASDPSTSYGAGGTGGGGGWGSGYYAGGSADRWTPSLSRRGRGAPVQSNEQRVKGLTHRIALRAFLYGTAGASVLGSFVFAWGLSQAKPDWSAIGRAAGGLQDASKKSREGVGGRG